MVFFFKQLDKSACAVILYIDYSMGIDYSIGIAYIGLLKTNNLVVSDNLFF